MKERALTSLIPPLLDALTRAQRERTSQLTRIKSRTSSPELLRALVAAAMAVQDTLPLWTGLLDSHKISRRAAAQAREAIAEKRDSLRDRPGNDHFKAGMQAAWGAAGTSVEIFEGFSDLALGVAAAELAAALAVQSRSRFSIVSSRLAAVAAKKIVEAAAPGVIEILEVLRSEDAEQQAAVDSSDKIFADLRRLRAELKLWRTHAAQERKRISDYAQTLEEMARDIGDFPEP